jgi:hypothetical protein
MISLQRRTLVLAATAACLAAPLVAENEQQQRKTNVNEGALRWQDPAGLMKHEIGEFGSCAFFKKRGVRWRERFADGSALEVRCEPGPGGFLPGFHVWLIQPDRRRVEIGSCIFDAGFNEGSYYTDPVSGTLVTVIWQNIDGGRNDGGARRIDRVHFTGTQEPYLDVVRWVFDARTRTIETLSEKYEYLQKAELPHNGNADLGPYVGSRADDLTRSFTTVVGAAPVQVARGPGH